MSSDNDFLDDRNLKRLDRELQLVIARTGIDRRTADEVFDKYTLRTIEKFFSGRVLDIIDFPISTGKEGNVFRAVTPDKKMVAVKIYRTSNATFKHMSQYIIGDPRFKSLHKTRKDIIYAWTQKEFKNLERLKKIGVKAPKPIIFKDNILIMEYIGDEEQPAPLLKDVTIDNPEKTFKTIISYISKMYKKANLVHGDISAYNILYFKNKCYLIDLGQGVLIEHPNALEFLKRDIKNVVSYFNKYNIRADADKIYNKILNKKT
jgi:RIO kinase 1